MTTVDRWAAAEGILCYGHDEVLLATRQHILQMLGMPVEIASTASAFHDKLVSANVALVLLCQTLSTEDCLSAAAYVKENSPASKVLVMYNRPGKCNLPHDHADLFSGDGPQALLGTVKKLIHEESTAIA